MASRIETGAAMTGHGHGHGAGATTKRPTLTTAPLGETAAALDAESKTPIGPGGRSSATTLLHPTSSSADTSADADASTPTDIHPDLTLPITLSHAITFLTACLAPTLPAPRLAALRTALAAHLTPKLAATWDPARPSHGSAIRSLIALPGTLPPPLLVAAAAPDARVDVKQWAGAISETGEWEMWIDPGSVCWRDGGWMWCEEGFEWRTYKQTLHTVWQTPLSLTPSTPLAPSLTRVNAPSTVPLNLSTRTLLTTTSTGALAGSTQTNPNPAPDPALPRTSHAIPIRAPAVFRIPPTPLPPTVEMGGLSLLDGAREAREALVGEMMACPPSPGAFRRVALPAGGVAAGTAPQGRAGAAGEQSNPTLQQAAKSKLLPAVEINGLVAKKAGNAVLRPATVTPSGASVWSSAVKAAPSAVNQNSTAPPIDSLRRSTSSMSSSGSQAGLSESDAGSSVRSGPTSVTSLPGSRNVSGSSQGSSSAMGKAVHQPQTPDLGAAAFPVLGKNTPQAGNGVDAGTPTTATATPAAGTGAVRGRAPGPGATGLAVSVQPYDGGNVGVLGGGVKLGGAGALKTAGAGYKNKYPGSAGTPTAGPGPGSGSGSYPPERGASPAGYTQDDLAMPDGSAAQHAQQRGTATSPARPVKRRRGKPQARPWLPKSHTSFVGAIAMGAPGLGPAGGIPPHVQAFPPNHIRGVPLPASGQMPLGAGYPGVGLGGPAVTGSSAVPLPPPALGAPGIWGSPASSHAAGFGSTGGYPSPMGFSAGQHQSTMGSSHDWSRAAPFVPGTPGRS